MRNYEKPDLELKTIATSDCLAAGLSDWLSDSNLSDVGITTAELYMTVS